MGGTATVRRRVHRIADVARQVVAEARDEQLTFMARSVAYSAFVSLIPLLLLLVVVATLVGGETLAQSVLSRTEAYLTPSAQDVVAQSLGQSPGQVGVSLLGLAALLWGALNVFRGLDTAFSVLYRIEADGGLLEQVRDGIVVFAAITVAILVVLAASVALALLPAVPSIAVLDALFLIAGLTVAFLPMYYVFPDVDVTIREVLPGTVVAAVGWTALQGLFGVYVSIAGDNEVYGAIGGIILLVTWLYFAATVLLLGAATNVVLAGRHRTPDEFG